MFPLLQGRGPGRGLAPDTYNMEEVVYNSQYRELLSVVNAQKHQLSSLQADVTKVSDVTDQPW